MKIVHLTTALLIILGVADLCAGQSDDTCPPFSEEILAVRQRLGVQLVSITGEGVAQGLSALRDAIQATTSCTEVAYQLFVLSRLLRAASDELLNVSSDLAGSELATTEYAMSFLYSEAIAASRAASHNDNKATLQNLNDVFNKINANVLKVVGQLKSLRSGYW